MPGRRRDDGNLTKNQPTNHRDIRKSLGYPSGVKANRQWIEGIHDFRKSYVSPEGTLGTDLLSFRRDHEMLAEMARAYLSHNGTRYWPDSDNSTNANMLTYSKDEVKITILLKQLFWRLNGNEKKSAAKKSRRRATTVKMLNRHGKSTADAFLVEELDFGYFRGIGAVPQPLAPAPREAPGPENRADFTSFTFAAKEEDTEAPGISSVPPFAADGTGQGSSVQQDSTPDQVRPLRPQENNADMDQDGQFDGATLNNATDNISPPNPNPGPRLADGSEASGNIPRRRNVTRRYMPPRNRRRPRNLDGYASEGTLEEYMRSSSSSESNSDSDTQSEQMNNSTENIEKGPSEPTNVANEQAGLAAGMPTDDRNIEEMAADIWNEHLGQHDTDTGRHGFNENQDPPDPPRINEAPRLGPDEMSNAQTNNSNDTSEAREAQPTPGQAPPVLEPPRDPLQANESREPDEQLDFQTSDDAHMNEAEASNEAHSDVDPNAVPLPQLHFHYFLLLDRGTGVDPVPWTPGRRLMELTWSQLERDLPVQLLMASDILLIRVFGFKQIQGRQEEFRQDDMGFDMSMRRLNGKVEEIQNAYSDLARIDLRIEIEAGMHFMRGPPLAEREPEANWF